MGEALIVLDPDSAGPLRSVAGFVRHFGGAEVNVAVALDRLQVHYYRAGSAASRLRYDDLDVDHLLRARVLHLTGITPLLSTRARTEPSASPRPRCSAA